MRQYLTLILALLLVIGSGAARWLSARDLRKQEKRVQERQEELVVLNVQLDNAKIEKKRYDTLDMLARRIELRTVWESDSTNLLRWFAKSAAKVGVRLDNSQMLSPRVGDTAAAGGEYDRTRYELHLSGEYGPLVRYVERVEQSPYPMLIEHLIMNASRTKIGQGELKLVVSCLSPAPPKPEKENENKDRKKDGEPS